MEKLPAHPEYAKAAPVDKAVNKKVKSNRKRNNISWVVQNYGVASINLYSKENSVYKHLLDCVP